MLVIKRVLQCLSSAGFEHVRCKVQNTNELPHKNRKLEASVARAGARESASKHNKVKRASFLFEFSSQMFVLWFLHGLQINLYSAPSRILQ